MFVEEKQCTFVYGDVPKVEIIRMFQHVRG